MSVEQQRQISSIVNWGFKIALAVAAWSAVSVFSGIQESIKVIESKVTAIEINMIRMEDRIGSQGDAINYLNTRTTRLEDFKK